MSERSNTIIATWLFGVCGLVFMMVVVGGLTRLTNSGLSMVEWRPLMGALPPMSDIEWERVYALYKNSPEFEKKHFWMEIGDFKQIFFWEWSHRLLGRLVGVVYALPLIFFWIKNMIPKGYTLKLLVPFILGGLQGLMGWYMVMSGLVDHPEVSHFRLAAHLLLAFLIIAVLLWLGLSIRSVKRHSDPVLFRHGVVAFILLCCTILWGAFTAGLDAGLIYNDTFPKMGNHWLPDILTREGFSLSLFSGNHETVQFLHRWLAIGSALALLSLWFHGVLRKNAFPALHLLAVMVFVQFSLGLATLYSGVDLHLAAMHQSGGLIPFVLTIICLKILQSEK